MTQVFPIIWAFVVLVNVVDSTTHTKTQIRPLRGSVLSVIEIRRDIFCFCETLRVTNACRLRIAVNRKPTNPPSEARPPLPQIQDPFPSPRWRSKINTRV